MQQHFLNICTHPCRHSLLQKMLALLLWGSYFRSICGPLIQLPPLHSGFSQGSAGGLKKTTYVFQVQVHVSQMLNTHLFRNMNWSANNFRSISKLHAYGVHRYFSVFKVWWYGFVLEFVITNINSKFQVSTNSRTYFLWEHSEFLDCSQTALWK